MELNAYQDFCNRDSGPLYPSVRTGNLEAVAYNALALSGEAGEVANKIKKVWRGDRPLDDGVKEQVIKELGGCMWYIAMLSMELGYDLEEVAQKNIDTIRGRLERGTIRGDGDDR